MNMEDTIPVLLYSYGREGFLLPPPVWGRNTKSDMGFFSCTDYLSGDILADHLTSVTRIALDKE